MAMGDSERPSDAYYPRKKKGSFLHKYKESHTPKSIKDP